MINLVAAADEFEIVVVKYDPDAQNAQISIKNIGDHDYHDVTIAIGDLEPVNIVGLLRIGNAIKVPRGIPPGDWKITVAAAEGVSVTKELNFPKSEKQVKREMEIRQIIEEKTGEKFDEKSSKAFRNYETGDNSIRNLLIGVFVIIILLFFFFFIKKGKSKEPFKKQKIKTKVKNIKKTKNFPRTVMVNYPQQFYNNRPRPNVPVRNYNNVAQQQPVVKTTNVFDRLKQIKSM